MIHGCGGSLSLRCKEEDLVLKKRKGCFLEKSNRLHHIKAFDKCRFLPIVGIFIGAMRLLKGSLEILISPLTLPFNKFGGIERLTVGSLDFVYGLLAIATCGLITYFPEVS